MTLPPGGGPAQGSAAGPSAPPTCYRHPQRETWIRCQRCDRPICPDCMRSAAVGFQCPDCVREGVRTTRQARTPYGGRRVADPRLTTYALIGLNALVWLAITVTGGRASRLVDLLALRPDGVCQLAANSGQAISQASCQSIGGLWHPGVDDGAWWQLLTSQFTHVQLLHLFVNMIALFFLGPMLEQVLGRARFLAVYLVSGMCGSAAVVLLSDPHIPTVGASGAIFGLLGALGVVALKVQGQVQQVLFWIGLNLVLTFSIPGISWQGHVGGLVGGLVMGAAMVYAPRNHRALVQWSVTGLVLALALALVAVWALTPG